MRLERRTAGALAAGALLLTGGGAALAASGDGSTTPSAKCDQRLAKAAETRGVSVEQLRSEIQGRLLARIDTAEKAGRLSSERAAKLRDRVTEGGLCGARRHLRARAARHSMLRAAATFLDLDRQQLRTQLPGTSLSGLAAKQGKSTADLEAAMLAPAKARVAQAVADAKLTQARADMVLERLGKLADRLVTRELPA
jgi:hypothetical protein